MTDRIAELEAENAGLRALVGVLWTSRRIWQGYALYLVQVVAGYVVVEITQQLGIPASALLEIDRVLNGEEPK